MRRQRTTPILALCALVATFALACSPPKNTKPRPVAAKGVLDLRQWDFEKDGPIELKGEWEFYWKQLLEPGGSAKFMPSNVEAVTNRVSRSKTDIRSPSGVEGNIQYIQAPGKWNAHVVDGKEIGGQGFATYRLKVLLPKGLGKMALLIPDQETASRMFWGNNLVAESGIVSDKPETAKPLTLTFAPEVEPAEAMHLLLQVAGFWHPRSGATLPISLGPREQIFQKRDRARLLEGLLAGALIIMGLYHFALFFYRRQDRAAFWFGLLCLTMSLRLAVTGERLLIEALPNMPWLIYLKLEYLAFYALIPGWTLFLHNLYPQQMGRLAVRLFLYPSLLAVVAVITLPADWFTHTLVPFEILVVLAMCLAMYALIKAVKNKEQGARLILSGFIVFFAATINDILYNQFLIGIGFVVPLGLFFFLFAQAGALAHRIAAAFNSSEDLSANLETKVEERTQALEKAKEATEKQRHETENLNALIKSLNEDMGIGIIMKKVHAFIKENFNMHYYGLAVVEKSKERLVTIDSASPAFLTEEEMARIGSFSTKLQDKVGAHAFAFKTKKPFYVPDAAKRKTGLSPDELFIFEKLKLESLLVIPLILQNEPIGFLDLYNVAKMKLSKADITKLSILGEQLAGIIHGSNLFKEVAEEREKSEKLLLNILPQNVATELKVTGAVVPQHFESASVLFTDFVGFTKISETMSAAELVKELDGCFSQFDEVIKHNNLEKLKTIGDAYMCAGGIPVANQSHAIDICLAALEFRAFMLQMQEIKASLGLPYWQLRIGINTGPVTAGVVGTNKFAYDIWGDTVNTASRMESSGTPGQINISGATYEQVKAFFDCEYRGKIEAKGKGAVDMYYLLRIKQEFSADAEGKTPNAKFEMQRVELGV